MLNFIKNINFIKIIIIFILQLFSSVATRLPFSLACKRQLSTCFCGLFMEDQTSCNKRRMGINKLINE